jgi:gas vesicle protein
MRDRTGVLIGAMGGAIVGAVAGYLFLADNGRTLRRRLEPELGGLWQEFGRLRESVERAGVVAEKGWRTATEGVGKDRGA